MTPHTFKRPLAGLVALTVLLGAGERTAAHPHEVTTGTGRIVVIANGQNHPGFVFNPATGQYESCDGINDLPNSGPAGYGLETAHHGPDAGTPGKGDGCYATDGPPQDNNPAID